MSDNIFRFRRLKWRDPERKLQMLPPEPPGRGAWLSVDLLLIVFTLTATGFCILSLL